MLAATVSASVILSVEGLPLLFGINPLTSHTAPICNSMTNGVASIVISKSTGE